MIKCPHCNSDDAYVGFTSIECINAHCKFYSFEWYLISRKEIIDDTPVTDPEYRADIDTSNSGNNGLFSMPSMYSGMP